MKRDAPPFENGDEVTLSTGQTVELPAYTRATMSGVVLPASRTRVADLLPPGLSPVRAGFGTGAVGFLSVEYHDIGRGALDPYDEFAVILAARPDSRTGVASLSVPTGIEGYVWYMPVTTEPARAFGDEIWGYPKVVAEVEITEEDGHRRTTVTADGERVVTMAVEKPPTVTREETITAYTEMDGSLLGTRGDLSGEMGAWPFSRRFAYSLGDHPKAETLRGLELGDRAFGRFYADGEVVFGAGNAV
ncbi:Acetoacetate decarboxylase (ADC) [Halopelagius inordinatus]|uniref:Acetoacetate decarboxylase (ADC) n=1 Tax=Halopelagius inordinatus TaxID=553467 RepID=A0A1I2SII6_9EURY|nr:acetoacetate decarboxylase family protein [Halopelagius inordinatus]SFG49751.1 Acetoacetate decarboxylase (ADC) [Halopelagius inordinatus]